MPMIPSSSASALAKRDRGRADAGEAKPAEGEALDPVDRDRPRIAPEGSPASASPTGCRPSARRAPATPANSRGRRYRRRSDRARGRSPSRRWSACRRPAASRPRRARRSAAAAATAARRTIRGPLPCGAGCLRGQRPRQQARSTRRQSTFKLFTTLSFFAISGCRRRAAASRSAIGRRSAAASNRSSAANRSAPASANIVREGARRCRRAAVRASSACGRALVGQRDQPAAMVGRVGFVADQARPSVSALASLMIIGWLSRSRKPISVIPIGAAVAQQQQGRDRARRPVEAVRRSASVVPSTISSETRRRRWARNGEAQASNEIVGHDSYPVTLPVTQLLPTRLNAEMNGADRAKRDCRYLAAGDSRPERADHRARLVMGGEQGLPALRPQARGDQRPARPARRGRARRDQAQDDQDAGRAGAAPDRSRRRPARPRRASASAISRCGIEADPVRELEHVDGEFEVDQPARRRA